MLSHPREGNRPLHQFHGKCMAANSADECCCQCAGSLACSSWTWSESDGGCCIHRWTLIKSASNATAISGSVRTVCGIQCVLPPLSIPRPQDIKRRASRLTPPGHVVLAAFSGGSTTSPKRTRAQLRTQSYLRAFICSVLSIKDAHLFLFLSPPPTLSLLSIHLQRHPRVHLLPPTGNSGGARLQHGRYLDYLSLLRRLGPNASKVVLSDASDVVFQSSPFPLIQRGLYTAEESNGYTLGSHPANAMWVRELYGADKLRQVGHLPVLCSGLTMGTAPAILAYLEKMAAEGSQRLTPVRLVELRRKHGRDLCRGFDQGMHNMLIRTRMQEATTILPGAAGPILNGNEMSCGRDVALNGSRLAHGRGTRSTVAVAHQYGRIRGECQQRVRRVLTCRGDNVPSEQPAYCQECSRTWPDWLGDASNPWRSSLA